MIKGLLDTKPYHRSRVYINGKQISCKNSLQYIQSSWGFGWGYAGSGPSQLAFAILLELTNEDIAYKLYYTFEREFIAKLPDGNFSIPEEEVWKAIKKCSKTPNRYIRYVPHVEKYGSRHRNKTS